MSKIFRRLVILVALTIMSTLFVSMAFSLSVPGMSTIYGHVNVNGKPQSGVIVYGGAGETSTDSSGYYEMNAVNNSKTTLHAVDGNYSASTDVTVNSASQQVPDMNIAEPTPTPTVTPTPSPNATATPTPTPSPTTSVTPTPTTTPTPSPSASVSATPTATITPTPTVTPTPTATATPAPTQQAPASQPASNQQVVYVTVTVTPAPSSDDLANVTTNDLISLNDTPTPTSTPLPSPTKARSPGFGALLALSCLSGAALAVLMKKRR